MGNKNKEFSAFDGTLLAVAELKGPLTKAYLSDAQRDTQLHERNAMWKSHFAAMKNKQ